MFSEDQWIILVPLWAVLAAIIYLIFLIIDIRSDENSNPVFRKGLSGKIQKKLFEASTKDQ